MDFFRKFFPLCKKNKTSDIDNNYKSKDRSLDITNVLQEDSNTNISDRILPVDNIEEKTTQDGPMEEIINISDYKESLHSVQSIPSSKVSPNDTMTDQKAPEFEVNEGIMPETLTSDVVIEENSVKTIVDDGRPIDSGKNVLESSTATNDLVSDIDTTALIETEPINDADKPNYIIDDETKQSLKEFDEALSNYESINNFRTEFINLDEFYEIFDTVIDDNSVIDSFVSKNENTNDNNIETIKDDVEICNDLDVVSNIIEDIDIISINSSTKDNGSQTVDEKESIYINSDINEDETQSSECDGYNSSDFEFISETEANMNGFIINFRGPNSQNSSQTNSEVGNNVFDQINDDRINLNDAFDPGEGPSRHNRVKTQFEDRSYRDNHHVPLGDDYLALFQGIYNPAMPMSEIYFLENKSVRTSAMNSQYSGLGFDKQLALRRHEPDSSEDEFADEAKECAKRILNTYPRENRKRRRRH